MIGSYLLGLLLLGVLVLVMVGVTELADRRKYGVAEREAIEKAAAKAKDAIGDLTLDTFTKMAEAAARRTPRSRT
jgi:hypothetical protein